MKKCYFLDGSKGQRKVMKRIYFWEKEGKVAWKKEFTGRQGATKQPSQRRAGNLESIMLKRQKQPRLLSVPS
jgi:hypothetical protein